MKRFQANQPITVDGVMASREILESLQSMARELDAAKEGLAAANEELAAANAKLAAIAAITPLSGGGGDSRSRNAINNIIAAAGT